jgi:hypothetical protein
MQINNEENTVSCAVAAAVESAPKLAAGETVERVADARASAH